MEGGAAIRLITNLATDHMHFFPHGVLPTFRERLHTSLFFFSNDAGCEFFESLFFLSFAWRRSDTLDPNIQRRCKVAVMPAVFLPTPLRNGASASFVASLKLIDALPLIYRLNLHPFLSPSICLH